MATSSSSTSAKKVAKLAQRGKGKKVRFQGGTLFPAVVLGVVIIGLLTIVYSRESRPDPGSFPPQVGDHWHAAYGMYVCDGWLPKLTGTQEETVTDTQGNTTYTNDLFGTTGVHSHADGVIHYHPYSSKSVGKRATIGVFLDVYGVELDTDHLKLPASQGGEEYKVGDYKCNGKDVEIKVVAWDSYLDTGKGSTYITDLTDVHITRDQMVFAIVVAPKDTPITMPPWASELPELGSADQGNVPVTTIAGSTGTAPVDTSTVDTSTGDTTTGGTTPATGTESTEPVTSATDSVTATTGG
ncbi:MAG: hypothetical protein JWN99_2218 [Ilumatobacteraceae bacterium]|nr:hypothetical protein [Ilumatobacteraceae bacterium]